MKRIVALLLLLLVLTGCGSTREPEKKTKKLRKESAETTEPASLPEELPTEEMTVPEETLAPEEIPEEEEVDPVLLQYRQLVEDLYTVVTYPTYVGNDPMESCFDLLSDTMEQVLNTSSDITYPFRSTIRELTMVASDGAEDYGYCLHDMNADGKPELFWVNADHRILAVFGLKKEKMVLLDSSWSRYQGYISEDNTYYCYGSDGADDNSCLVYGLDGSTLKLLFWFGTESNGEGGVDLIEGVGEMVMDSSDLRQQMLSQQFPAGISAFWGSVPIYSLERQVKPEDIDGSGTQKPTTESQRLPYLQKIKRADQPVYTGPGYEYPWEENLGKIGTYTIVAQIPGTDGELWGKLKTGDGWVDLTRIREENSNMPILTVAKSDENLTKGKQYEHFMVYADEYVQSVAISAHKDIRDISVYSLSMVEDDEQEQLLFSMAQLEAGDFFVAQLSFPGDMTTYGIRFADESGQQYRYILTDSGFGGLWLAPQEE